MKALRAIKGTRDILPAETPAWQRLESAARELFPRYGYREIRTPVFEETELFARGIGAETDIVAKEMYTFSDRGREGREGASLTLRPEATAGIVRAVIEHGLVQSDPLLKVFTLGPMFRREQPQKGRYRQFHQVNVEAFGLAQPDIDAEIVAMALAYLDACGLGELELLLNSVGDAACRPAYVELLRKELGTQSEHLCGDCQRRSETNPLRVLDCKVPQDQERIAALPRISEHLCGECDAHFTEVRRQLDLLGIPYQLNHRLVRGLDYYTRTTFEVTAAGIGAQNSVLGGGRYDGLVRELGGGDVPGIGFALGLERMILALPEAPDAPRCDVFCIDLDPRARDAALLLQRALRASGLRVVRDAEGRSFKARMKLANKLGARFVVIQGEEELKNGVWSVRDMQHSDQRDVAAGDILAHLKESLL